MFLAPAACSPEGYETESFCTSFATSPANAPPLKPNAGPTSALWCSTHRSEFRHMDAGVGIRSTIVASAMSSVGISGGDTRLDDAALPALTLLSGRVPPQLTD